MVNGCNQLIGEKCLNWNHEGQWLLPATRERDIYFNSGSMCTGRERYDNSDSSSRAFGESMVTSWAKYWDIHAQVLVEKSPQSILKSDLIRSVFRDVAGAGAIKFLVVLKHPSTLNTATVRDMSWVNKMNKDHQTGAYVSQSPLSDEELRVNMEHFMKLLSHDMSVNSSNSNSSKERCSLGWLDTMVYLHKQLQENKKRTLIDTRIIRYEYFEMPVKLCKALFRFIFDVESNPTLLEYNYPIVAQKVCEVVFTGKVRSASIGSKRGSRTDFMTRRSRGIQQRRALSDTIDLVPSAVDCTNISQQRALRLRSGTDKRFRDRQSSGTVQYASQSANTAAASNVALDSNHIDFQLQLVRSSRAKRFAEFKSAMDKLGSLQDTVSSDMHRQLLQLLKRLQSFGYSFPRFDSFGTSTDLFLPWDIMNIEGKKIEGLPTIAK